MSIYNRWGYKVYSGPAFLYQNRAHIITPDSKRNNKKRRKQVAKSMENIDDGDESKPLRVVPKHTVNYVCNNGEGGPTCGTSLSLMAKLVLAHVFYNSGYVGFESSWFAAEGAFSPIGDLQLSVKAWLSKYGSPGMCSVNTMDGSQFVVTFRYCHLAFLYTCIHNVSVSNR